MSEKTGIDQLRSLPRYVYSTIETANGRVIDKRFAVTVTEDEAIAIADQIEREHMDALNEKIETICKLNRECDSLRDNRKALVEEAKRNQYAAGNFHRERDEALKKLERMEKKAKRDLTSEAREAVERLREIATDNIYSCTIAPAVGVERFNFMDDDKCNELRDRIIELIEHGGKQDVDVAAFRELADDLESLEVTTSSADLASGYEQGCEYAAGRIREAIEATPKPDAESDAERACAALLDWRDRVAGMLGIDAGSMADEVQDAIMAELDKRLMPPGMAWPRWDDGKQVSHYDTLEDATAICLALDGSCYSLHYDMPDGERVCLFDGSERVKRPEPEVLGADGEPIKVGDTVYDVATGDRYTVFGLPPFNNGPVRLYGYINVAISSCNLTHTRPETQKLIDKQSKMHPLAYCRYVLKWDGEDVKRTDDIDCWLAMTADLLRRQRELDAKTMGGAR